MQITCAKCGYKQDVPDEKIPPKAEKATCPQCKEKFRFRTVLRENFLLEPEPEQDQNTSTASEPGSGYLKDQDQKEDDSIWSSLESMGGPEGRDHEDQVWEEPESGYEVPWENLDKNGFFPGFIETVKRVMLAPATFFYKMPLKGMFMPLAFFLIIAVVQGLATFIWNMAGVFPTTAHHGAGDLGMGMMGIGSIFIIIIYPLFLGFWLFIASGITHLFLTLFQAGKSGFEATFRATAYGSAPMILGILPFLGPVAGALWSLGVTIIGYKNIHESSFLKVIMAMFAPIFVLIIIAAFMY
jgi:hypothetical protein